MNINNKHFTVPKCAWIEWHTDLNVQITNFYVWDQPLFVGFCKSLAKDIICSGHLLLGVNSRVLNHLTHPTLILNTSLN